MADVSDSRDFAVRPASDLSRVQAQRLTDKIRKATDNLWSLLLESYERKAWAVLGFASFKHYVETEFGLSKGQAYRLIDQGGVIRELQEAAGVEVEVSARQAVTIKPDLPAVVEAVREATKGKRAGRQQAAQKAIAKAAQKPIDAPAVKILRDGPQVPDQQVHTQESRARDSATDRVSEAFGGGLEAAIEALVAHKPADAKELAEPTFKKLKSWVQQVDTVRRQAAQPSTNGSGCTHRDAAGKETVNKLPYIVTCTQCKAKVR